MKVRLIIKHLTLNLFAWFEIQLSPAKGVILILSVESLCAYR